MPLIPSKIKAGALPRQTPFAITVPGFAASQLCISKQCFVSIPEHLAKQFSDVLQFSFLVCMGWNTGLILKPEI